MPLEILVDTKENNGIRKKMLKTLVGMDSLVQYLQAQPYIGRPLSITEGLKFAKQAFYEGDSVNYSLPTEYDLPGLQPYLSTRNNPGAGGENTGNAFNNLLSTFIDSNKRQTRISVSM